MSNNSSNTCIIKNKSIASLNEVYKLIIRGGWMMTVTVVYYDFGKKETVRETREIDD